MAAPPSHIIEVRVSRLFNGDPTPGTGVTTRSGMPLAKRETPAGDAGVSRREGRPGATDPASLQISKEAV